MNRWHPTIQRIKMGVVILVLGALKEKNNVTRENGTEDQSTPHALGYDALSKAAASRLPMPRIDASFSSCALLGTDFPVCQL